MLGEEHVHALPDEGARQSRVEERGVLVGVNELELPRPDLARQAANQAEIEARPAGEADDRDAFGLHALAELPDGVQAEHHGVNRRAEPSNRFGDKHFRAGYLHDVKHEADAQPLCAQLSHAR
jgi:hypothetical protein